MRACCFTSAIVVGVGRLICVPAVLAQTNPYCMPTYRYAQPTYYQAPAYQAQTYQAPGYYYPAQKIVAQNVTVAPLIVTVPIDSKAVPAHAFGQAYYYSVSDAFTTTTKMREVIRDELRNVLGGATLTTVPSATGGAYQAPPQAPAPQAGSQPPQTRSQPPGDAAPPPPPAPEAPQATQLDITTPPELQNRILAAFKGKGNCINCHNPEGESKFKMLSDDGRLLALSSDKRWKVYGMASTGAMPPKARNDASQAMESEFLPDLLKWAVQK